MKINYLLLPIISAFFLFSTDVDGQYSEATEFNVFQIGISPRSHNGITLRNNKDFEIDGLVFEPIGTFTRNNTNVDIHLGYQKYGSSRNVFHVGGWFNYSNQYVSLKETNLEIETETPFSNAPSSSNTLIIDDRKRTIIGLETAYYWRAWRPDDKKFYLNLGVGIETIYSSQNYFTFTQSTRTVNSTKKKGVALALITPVDINYRITEKIGLGLNIGIKMFNKYFVMRNDLNLDPDNPLNADFFRNPFESANLRLTASYFLSK